MSESVHKPGCTASGMRGAESAAGGPLVLLAARCSPLNASGGGLGDLGGLRVANARGAQHSGRVWVQGKHQRRAGADAVSQRLQDCSCPL